MLAEACDGDRAVVALLFERVTQSGKHLHWVVVFEEAFKRIPLGLGRATPVLRDLVVVGHDLAFEDPPHGFGCFRGRDGDFLGAVVGLARNVLPFDQPAFAGAGEN
jgi:hypothetical protein